MSLPIYYRKAPVLLQSLILNIKGYLINKSRFNKNFKNYLDYYVKNDYNKLDEIEFRKFLLNASRSNFWKNRFANHKLDLNAKDIINEIKKLPILTKQEVINNFDKIKININTEKINKVKTSGTTGSGLVFFETQSMSNKQWAIWWRYRLRFGIKFNTWWVGLVDD